MAAAALLRPSGEGSLARVSLTSPKLMNPFAIFDEVVSGSRGRLSGSRAGGRHTRHRLCR